MSSFSSKNGTPDHSLRLEHLIFTHAITSALFTKLGALTHASMHRATAPGKHFHLYSALQLSVSVLGATKQLDSFIVSAVSNYFNCR